MTIDTQMLKYNALDSAVTLACMHPIWEELAENGYEQTYSITEDVLPALVFMACRGINVDKGAIDDARSEAKQSINEQQEKLNEAVGRPLNPLSPKACQAYFYGELGIPPYTKTSKDSNGRKKQSITTDDKAMARLARGTTSRAPIPTAAIIQSLRGLHKLVGTYLEIEFDSDGRLRCSVNPRGTKFSRISTSQTIFGTGGNLQNLPETFKRFMIADPGCLLYEMDKSQAEWVVVAYASGDANMISVCESGMDPHTHTAHEMFGVDKSIIKMENDLLGHLSDPDEITELRSNFEHRGIDISKWPRNMSLRQAGKKSNHGLNYDEAYRTFALQNMIQDSEAKRIISMYHEDAYPGIRHWYENVQTRLRNDRTLYNCFGRKYKFLEQWGGDLFKAAYAFEPQSTVGDLINIAITKVYNDDTPPFAHTEMLIQVHDSILNQFHLRDSGYNYRHWAQAIMTQQDYMNPAMVINGREFHIGTDLKVGDCWGTMHEVPIGDSVNELEDRLEDACKDLDI